MLARQIERILRATELCVVTADIRRAVQCSQNILGQSLYLEAYSWWASVFEQESSPGAAITRWEPIRDMALEHLGRGSLKAGRGPPRNSTTFPTKVTIWFLTYVGRKGSRRRCVQPRDRSTLMSTSRKWPKCIP